MKKPRPFRRTPPPSAPVDVKGLCARKSADFSAWFTEVIQKAELADIRYHIKGFLVFQPWAVLTMERMYALFERVLQEKGHHPYWFPTVIPESNFTKEATHIAGFTPEVFWVTGAGGDQFQERLALRPTSETAFYQMFALWIRSYKDLPFKTYQRAQVFRYETKATRPFLRTREIHWIETHCVHATLAGAEQQVQEDMQTTTRVLGDFFGLPFLFFERPAWDRFPGAHRTFAADVLNPDGKVVQQPSTHILKQAFPEAFGVHFFDSDQKKKTPWLTCYGPAISRLFASVLIVHGDDKGMRLPWELAPYHVVIVPVQDDPAVHAKAENIARILRAYVRVHVDTSEHTAGEKFNTWELKGVPLRIDIGLKDMAQGKVTLFRRDTNTKLQIGEGELTRVVHTFGKEYDTALFRQAATVFTERVVTAHDMKRVKKALEEGQMVRCAFCSVEEQGRACAEQIIALQATVRGTRLTPEKVEGTCVVCGKKGKAMVYLARQY
jgi:prolyl-tRNA synthetase